MKRNVMQWLYTIACDHCSHGKHNLVAAIMYKKRPISIGYNSYIKTHPLQRRITNHPQKIFIHAEIDAVIKALNKVSERDLKCCDLYICRVKRNGDVGIAKPCENCYEFVKHRVNNIYYTENK